MDDISFGSAILIGAWAFFVTARPRWKNNSDPQSQQPLPETFPARVTISESENWSFELESSDRSAIEQGDRWVMG